ncbi:50S ribosomal protein L25/general stress protein Ctc [Streptomyces sp. H27-C3]|uniref:50S ribosomal protein L25/general stress protein Ctc n=1 Tax=Streptomyces sp. H27-C3 TaxID=3046305 RepID=UPI0024BAD341|nr:50S ribosomal protein L25/general stress protein Ctc [Streptomyces sp. H27-C3]MDJ0460476.1 50S ribosomal protein L25/general stress protein Ctc [Streptomyces sp. H27-C3]
MAEIKIAAEVRNSFGKGASRQTRRDNRVPGVVYGHGADPLHITLPAHELMMALKTSNALLRLEVDGKTELVIPKAIQRNAIRRNITHVDLLSVKLGEKVTVDVSVHTEGELAPGGNLLENVLNTLSVETEATHIPSSVTVSIAGLEAGATIHAKDIPLPEGTTLVTDPEAVVIQVLAPKEEAVAETADETPEA